MMKKLYYILVCLCLVNISTAQVNLDFTMVNAIDYGGVNGLPSPDNRIEESLNVGGDVYLLQISSPGDLKLEEIAGPEYFFRLGTGHHTYKLFKNGVQIGFKLVSLDFLTPQDPVQIRIESLSGTPIFPSGIIGGSYGGFPFSGIVTMPNSIYQNQVMGLKVYEEIPNTFDYALWHNIQIVVPDGADAPITRNPDANNILYVDKNVSGGDQSGSSWANAIPELADATGWAKLNENPSWASTPLQIWVAKGTYNPKYSPGDAAFGVDQTRKNAFLMVKNVQLYGGFAGNESALVDRDLSLETNASILDGNIGTINDDTDNTYHVVVGSEDLGTAKLDGFTISNANADGDGSLIVNGNTLEQQNAGGIYYKNGASDLTNLTISNNKANSGGGLYISDASPSLTNVVINGNTVSDLGGGIYSENASIDLNNVTINGNGSASGGGLYINGASSANLANVTISGNTVSGLGGGIYNTNASLSLSKVAVKGNSSTSGGGIYNDGGSQNLTNVTISGNSGTSGAGIYNKNASPSLTNVTLSGNSGTSGIAIYNTFSSSPSITNSIVWGDIYADSGSGSTATYSFIQGSTLSANGNIPDPGLLESGFFRDSANSDYRLKPCSPAVDTGNSGAISETEDILGNPRVFGPAVDLGAYELQEAPGPVISGDIYVDASVSVSGDGLSWPTAFKTLVEAKGYAANEKFNCVQTSVIHIAQGTYLVNGNLSDETESLVVGNNDLQILGGYPSGGGTRNPTVNPTIISGDLNGNNIADFNTQRSDTHTIITLLADNITIDGLILEHAFASGNFSSTIGVSGAGIYANNAGNLKINNCIFRDLRAKAKGAAIVAYNSDLSVINSLFYDNKTYDNGGAISVESGSGLNLTNCTFANNSGSTSGGALKTNGNPVTIVNTIFAHNEAGTDPNISGSATSIDYSYLEGENPAGTGNIDDTANLFSIRFKDVNNDDYGLKNTSRAVNAGDNAAYTNAGGDLNNDLDLAGNPRLYNGTPTTNNIDMGAFELNEEPLVVNPSPDANNILYVNKNVSDGNQSGNSWANAIPELADALIWAKQNETVSWATTPLKIWVATGTYTPEQDKTFSFEVPNNVKILGGFDGTETDLNARNVQVNPSILSGDLNNSGFTDLGDSYIVVKILGDNVTLDGLTIKHAYNTNRQLNSGSQFGAGVYNEGDHTTVKNCIIRDNVQTFKDYYYYYSERVDLLGTGAGFSNAAGNTTIFNTLFYGNEAYNGAGISIEGGTVNLANCTLTKNIASKTGGGIYFSKSGGGIVFPGGNLTAINTIFFNNSAPTHSNIDKQGVGTGTGSLNYCLLYGGNPTVSDVIAQNNTITTNPLFTDADNNDYTLVGTSPAINAGDNASYEAADGDPGNNSLTNDRDLAGASRLYDGTPTDDAIDMGAYEFQADALAVSPDAKNVLYVNNSLSTGTGEGNSWANAVWRLDDALNWATQNESNWTVANPLQIWVAAGTYKPGFDRADSFNIPNNVQLFGGFNGSETTVSERNWNTNPTILSGDLDNSGDSYAQYPPDSYRVVKIMGDNSTLNGFIVQYGYNTDYYSGAGIYNEGNNTTVKNCIIRKNTAKNPAGAGEGGGFMNVSGNSSIINSLFYANEAGNYGGAVSAGGGTVTLTNCTLVKNKAGNSGGVFYSNGNLIANNTIFATNTGNIFANPSPSGSATLDHCLVYNGGVSTGVTQTNAVTGNPLFTDIGNDDYTLKRNSFALNAGDDASYEAADGDTGNNSLTNDLDLTGNPRSFGTIDLGPYETQISPIAPSANNILYVDKNVSTADGNGDSWANALPELADALSWAKLRQANWTAANPLQIWVAKGTYNPLYSAEDSYFGTDQGRKNAFLMVKDVQLYGGFAGNESALTDRDLTITTNSTTLSGKIGVQGDYQDNNYHVVVSSGNVGTARLDGFTITGGNANNIYIYKINGKNVKFDKGGGISTTDSSPTLINLNISENFAQSGGGGISISGASLSLTNSIISENTAALGGGIYINNSSPTLTNVLISGNQASSTGGGIQNDNASPTLINMTISDNTAPSEGPAIYNIGGSHPTLKNCIVWGNIYNYPGTLYAPSSYTASYSFIENNTAISNNNLADMAYTKTNFFNDPANGDYSLKPCARVVNIGNNNFMSTTDTEDILGNPRIFGTTVDLGAYESQTPYAPGANVEIYVDASVSESGDGLSWNNALESLPEAKEYISSNLSSSCTQATIIHIAQGNYLVSDDNLDRNQSLIVNNDNLQIIGGYPNGGGTRNPALHPTILSGDLNQNNLVGQDTYNIIKVFSENVTLTGLIFDTALANNSSQSGAGVYAKNAINLKIKDCIFRNLLAEGNGAAIFAKDSDIDLINSVFYNNQAEFGGAISIGDGASIDIVNSTFVNNTATDSGGALNTNGNPVTVVNSIFSDNTATNGGVNINGTTTSVNYSYLQGETPSGTGNLNGTTINYLQYTDPANNDYSLKSCSPLVNSGDNTAISETGDILGNPRIFDGGIVDLGAYELQEEASPTTAVSIYVDASVASSGDGFSWGNAFKTLLEAKDYIANEVSQNCESASHIYIAQGTYLVTQNEFGYNAKSLVVNNDDLQILGGYPSGGGTRNPEAYPTIISGDLNGSGVPDAGDNHIILKLLSDNVTLDGLIIEGAYNYDFYAYGTGIQNFGDNTTIKSCIIRKNKAKRAGVGAGLRNSSGNTHIINTLFYANSTKKRGGAISIENGSVTLTNCTLTDNSAGTVGGGVSFLNGNLNAVNTIFANNTAPSNGNINKEGAGTGVLDYCLIYNGQVSAAISQTNGITENPLFANSDTNDYSLKITSSAVNVGTNVAYTNAGGDLANDLDLAGNPRLFDGNPDPDKIDLGAYEVQAEPAAIAPDANNILYVNKNVVGGTSEGNSWANAIHDLSNTLVFVNQNASNWTAADPLKIWVATGTYKPGTNQTDSFKIPANVKLLGGFDATESNETDRDWATNQTILSGDLNNTNAPDAGDSHSIITVLSANVLIDGFVVENSFADDDTDNSQMAIGRSGGGLYAWNASNLNVKHCVFHHNKAGSSSVNDGVGAAVISFQGDITLTNCLFFNNEATASGGAISGESGTVDLVNCTLANNDANSGGGVHLYTATVTATNSIFTNNSGINGNINDGGPGSASASYSLFYNSTNGNTGDVPANVTDDGNNLTDTDPIYNGNNSISGYRITAISPAMDSGSNTAYTNANGDLDNDFDLNGNPRLFHDNIDIGAYEQQTLQISPDANNIIYVDKNVNTTDPNYTGAGDSWANAVTELADALRYAKTNSADWSTNIDSLQVFVAKGTYKPLYSPTNNNFGNPASRDNAFLMVKDVQLYGGFDPANGIVDLNDARILPSSVGSGSILSGDIGTTGNGSDNAYHVLVSSGGIGTAVLDRFAIVDGNANSSGNYTVNGLSLDKSRGAGVYNRSSNPRFTNVIISGNTAIFDGGGMYNAFSSPKLTNVRILDNAATQGNGGGMYNNKASSPRLINVVISGNSANNANGGGMYNVSISSGSLTLINVTIAGNMAENGGGMYNFHFSPGLTNCIVWGNTATNNNNIQNEGSTPTITYSLVQGVDNTANQGLDGTNGPQFTDPANGDYSLLNTSPAIDVGNITVNTENFDVAGNPRFSGDAMDLGAYEFQDEPITDYIWQDNAWTPEDPSGVSTANDNILVVNGSTNLTADTEIKNITVDADATLNVEKVLTIAGDITNNGSFVFKSTATSNGELAEVPAGSTITGDVTVERYMSDHRSYRFISSAVTTSGPSGSIHDNWQEGANNIKDGIDDDGGFAGINQDPHPGYGTHITGSKESDPDHFGFDVTISGNPSLYTLNVADQEFNTGTVQNTDNTMLTAGGNYLLFVRGDRSMDLTSNASHGSTTLRSTGALKTGTVTQNLGTVPAGNFVPIANPYQCAIDVNNVIGNSTNLNGNFVYIYDPSLGSMGGYATVDLSSGTASGSTASQYIQPGQAAQVVVENTANTEIVFNESDKVPGPGSHNTTFSTENPFVDNAHINGHLYTASNYAAGKRMHDNFSLLFNPVFNNALTNRDAVKAFNFTENMGIGTAENTYSIEKRQLPTEGEEIALFNTGYENQNYTLVIEASDFDDNATPYLVDNYNGEQTELQTGENVINFSVDQDIAGSVAANRFSIHFGPSTLSVGNQDADYGITLYPNPAESGAAFYVTAGQFKDQSVNVSITDLLGKTVYNTTQTFNGGKITIKPNSLLGSGVYFVKIAQGDKTENKRLVVK